MKRTGRRFFEGWYFKHRIEGRVFAAIPGMAVDEDGKKSAFIQTISNEGALFHEFPIEAFEVTREPLSVRIGENIFSRQEMRLELPEVRAAIRYGANTPLEGGDIMGPFQHVPFMECRHGVISLMHPVEGFVEERGVRWVFDGGSGYIEKDWGRSFPETWVWMECHDFAGREDCSLMLAIAEIPFLGGRFTGVIGVCRVDGVQYRIATYWGARIVQQGGENGKYWVEVRQGRYRLKVCVEYGTGGELRAPCLGMMNRTITEHPCCTMHATFARGDHELLNADGHCCGFERVTKPPTREREGSPEG